MRKILISQRIIENATYPEQREALASDWGAFFAKLGMLPIPTLSRVPLVSYMHLGISGVILSGGNDLSKNAATPTNLYRDQYERELIEFAMQQRLPVLGTCRGMQLIADYFGNNIVPLAGHSATKHSINVSPNTKWANILNTRGTTNSFHEFGIRELKDGLIPLATCPDGSIEALAKTDYPMIGLMWHPERESTPAPQDLEIVRNLFDA